MADNRTISQLEAEGYPWIGCECCKGTVWMPFNMIRERLPNLSAMTLDELGAKKRCDKCGKRPERYYPANQSDTPGVRAKLLDAAELFGRLRRVGCIIAPQGERPIAIEASKRAGLIAAGCNHQDQFVSALRARRNGDQVFRL